MLFSAATLQHIPKEYVFNLLFEIKRVLSPEGRALLHLLSFKQLIGHCSKWRSWQQEIRDQLAKNERVHWHFFDGQEELEPVFAATGFTSFEVVDRGSLFACLSR